MKILVPALFLILVISCSPKKPNIVEWRGEDRNGIYHETDLLKAWPEEGPSELWYREGIGSGYGSPVIENGLIYISGAIDSTAWLHCLSTEGKFIWQSKFGKEWVVNFPGSRSAPTIVDDLIYVGSGMGNLYCLEKATGNVVWSKDFASEFQGGLPRFGHSESAVVDGDKVFWTPGGKEYNVVAMDRFSGDLLWANPGFGERSGYHPPKVITLSERKILVTFSAYHLMGLDVESGELLWSQEMEGIEPDKRKPGMGDTHANSVIFEDGAIYYATGDDGNFGVKLELSEDGTAITELWRNRDFDSYMGGIVKIDNYLYGSGTKKAQLKSINATTGVLADTIKVGRGVVIEADHMLYYYNFQGDLKLISYAEGKMEEVSSFKITRGEKEHFSHPVINNGVLYLRHGGVLMAFGLTDLANLEI
ncbi:MAG: PQQ-binding-like beta-propeller repeat protein [Bacteroides sp.]|nr:PQQ-binding-like beta-propeller repeat protein [Bacteroides sp.]